MSRNNGSTHHALQVRDGWWSWSIQAGGEGEAWLAAGPPVGQASDVVLPLHSLKKRGATWLEALEAMALAKGGWAGP